jgi:tetratricopeptide (TPR) repeat protein
MSQGLREADATTVSACLAQGRFEDAVEALVASGGEAAVEEEVADRRSDFGLDDANRVMVDKLIDAALERFPRNRSLLRDRARLNVAQGRYEEAVDALLATGSHAAVEDEVAARRNDFTFDDADRTAVDKLLDAALRRLPDNPRLLVDRARLCAAQGSYDRAQAALDRVLAADAANESALVEKIRTCRVARRFAEAESAVEAALAVLPKSSEILAEEGRVSLEQGRYEHAVESFVAAGGEAALVEEVDARLNRWTPLDESGAVIGKRLLGLAIERFPENPQLLAHRGRLCLTEGKYDDAIEVLGRIHVDDPLGEGAFLGRLRILRLAGKVDEAKRTATQALDRYPKSKDLWVEIGRLRCSEQQYPIAVEAFVSAADGKIDALVEEVTESLSSPPWSDGSQIDTEPLLDSSLDRFSGDPRLLQLRALLRISQERYDEAVEAIEAAGGEPAVEQAVVDRRRDFDFDDDDRVTVDKLLDAALRRFPRNHQLLIDRARLSVAIGNFERALKALDRVLRAEPGNEAALAERVRCYRMAGRIAEAQKALSDSLARAPMSVEIVAEQARLSLEQKRFGEAVGAFIASGRLYEAYEALSDFGDGERVHELKGLAQALLERAEQAPVSSQLGWVFAVVGDNESALEAFIKVLEASPYDEDALQGQALVLRLQNRLDEAEAVIKSALDDRPNSILLRLQRGWLSAARHKYERALEDFDHILVNDPFRTEAVEGKLMCLRSLDRFIDAEGLMATLQDWSRTSGVLNQWGSLLVERDEFTTASTVFEQAFEAAEIEGSNLAEAYWELGNGLGDAGAYEQALEAYDKALERDPRHLYALHNKANLLWNRGSFGDAWPIWDEARRLYEERSAEATRQRDADHFHYFGETLVDVYGEQEKAEQCFKQGLACSPDHLKILVALVRLYRDWKIPAGQGASSDRGGEIAPHWRAWEVFRRAERLLKAQLESAREVETYQLLGKLYLALEMYREAEEFLKIGLQLASGARTRASLFTDLGIVRTRQGQFVSATRYFREAVNYDREDLWIWSNLAEASLKNGNINAAENEYQRILGLAPGHVESHIGLSQVYTVQADNTEDADIYGLAIKHASHALALADSSDGSKRLTAVERASIHYSRGYARVGLYETSPIAESVASLDKALRDFRTCAQLDPSHHKATRAIEKIKRQRHKLSPQWLGERAAPLIVAGLSLIIFIFAQTALLAHLKFQNKELSSGYYVLLTFGSLLFMVAGLYLPRVLKLKVGALELEKSVVEQMGPISGLGIRT